MGDFPMMTDQGTFIINGTERVVVSQLVRSPGVYFGKELDKTSDKDLYIAKVIPSRGAWLEFEVDKRDLVGVRIDRKRRQNVTVLLKALGWSAEEILELFEGAPSIAATLEKDHFETPEEALEDIYRKLRPGDPPTAGVRADAPREPVLQPEALRPGPRRPVQGRQEAARRLRHRDPRPQGPVRGAEGERPARQRGLGAAEVRASTPTPTRPRQERQAQDHPHLRGHPEDGAVPREAPRRRGGLRGRRHRPLRQPAAALGRRADPEPDPDRPDPHGARRQGADDHPGRRGHHAADADQHPPGRRVDQGVLRDVAAVAVHGPDQPAGRPDPQAPPVGAGPGRPVARARGLRGPGRAPLALRPDVPDRDAGGPEHRPHRLALDVRADQRVRVRRDPVPQGREGQGHRADRLPDRRRGGPARHRPGEHAASTPAGGSPRTTSSCRRKGGEVDYVLARARSTTWTSRRSRSCRWPPR